MSHGFPRIGTRHTDSPMTHLVIIVPPFSVRDEDQHHWPYFNYISEQDQIENFLPNSDFQFTALRKKLLEEYKDYLDGH